MADSLFVIFDGNALVHRAFHALPPLTVRKTGELVGAVYGFAEMLLKVIGEIKPTCYAIAFDRPAPTFRHEMFVEYKATRRKTPDELLSQLGRVRQLVEAFHIPVYELDGYEADDVLGTLSRQASEQGVDTIIVTGDNDALQLVTPQVKVFAPKRGFGETQMYDEAAVMERYCIPPKYITDLKALKGDASDNIPGVAGIGEKTAVKLIQQFGPLEEIYVHISEVTPPRVQTLLREGEAIARQSKELATIDTEAPVILDLSDCQLTNYDRNRVAELFRELEFTRLISRLPENREAAPEPSVQVVAEAPPRPGCRVVDSAPALDELLARITTSTPLVFRLETTDTSAMSARIVGISLSPGPGETAYIPAGHVGLGNTGQLTEQYVLDRLSRPLGDRALPKLAHDAKYDMTVLAARGVEVRSLIFDTSIAAYLLSEKALTLPALVFNRLGTELAPLTALTGTGAKKLPLEQVEIPRVAECSCAHAGATRQLARILAEELKKEKLWALFASVEMKLVPVLVEMERNGIALDIAPLREMSQRFGEQMRKLEAGIYNDVGHQFNINSPQQLGRVLFEELNLPAGRRKKGSYSTEATILEELRGVHPVVEQVLEYRQLTKLKSTYIDALPVLLNPRTGRVHTSFNQTRTATGRLSSSDPNLQNIPVRGELGREIRKAFIAPPGHSLLSGDYSQIDLRALAHLSQDTALLEAFRHDEDIHTVTASRLYGVPLAQVTPDMRRLAKTVNFGVIYGMSEHGLEQATELSRREAASFIEAYFEKYPGISRYIECTKKRVREVGYVQTVLGRRRAVPEVNSPNRQIREAAERMAINMPVQGTSADIIKLAMIKLYRLMKEKGLRSRMLLQVHDDLLIEVPEAEMEEMCRIVPQVMCSAMKLSVPLKVDIKRGRNWGEMK